MPKKPNSHGDMQEYVPAGNGDASGEYGNSEGSNKHFEKFEKNNDDIIPILKQTLSKHIITEENIKNKIINELDSENIDKNVAKTIKEFYEKEKDYVINSALVKNSYCDVKNKQIVLNSETFNENNNSIKIYTNGGILFHETGHAIDYSYDDKDRCYSSSYISKEFNTTLSDMVYEEIRANINKDDFIKEYEQLKESYKTDEKYLDLVKQNEKLIEQKNEEYKKYENDETYLQLLKQSDESLTNWLDSKITREEMLKIKEQLDNREKELIGENSLYFQLDNQIKNNLDEKIKIMVKYESLATQKYGDLSDMCQASIDNYDFGMGHDPNYFSENSFEKYFAGRKMRGTEAFAEIISAKGTNPESYKLMQKYIPKALKIFEEIMQEYKKGGKHE